MGGATAARGGGKGFSRVFLNHELYLVFLVQKILYSPKTISSIYIWPLSSYSIHRIFFGGVRCCQAVLGRVLHSPVVLHDRVIYITVPGHHRILIESLLYSCLYILFACVPARDTEAPSGSARTKNIMSSQRGQKTREYAP